MAYHEGEGKAFTKQPAVLMMCSRSRGQMNRRDYLFVSLATRKKQKCLWNQAANTQSNSPIGSLSVQVSHSAGVAMSAVYLVSKTNGQWQRIIPCGALPGVCCGCYPFCSVLAALRCDPNLRRKTNDFQLSLQEERTTKGFHVRLLSVHSGMVVPLRLLPTTRASVLLSTCSVPTCYHFSPI